uniref:Uncharacterized protein n=1 Tax=Anguilla anguilla TaxID=7936 RepID=A0A0E9WVK8_ANGAN
MTDQLTGSTSCALIPAVSEQTLHHPAHSNHCTCLLHRGMAASSLLPPQTPPSGTPDWTCW